MTAPASSSKAARVAMDQTTRLVFLVKAQDPTMTGAVAAELVAATALEVLAALAGNEAASAAGYRLADVLATAGGGCQA